MILSFIEGTLSSKPEPVKNTEVQAKLNEKDIPVSTYLQIQSNKENSFEEKYKMLIQQIEKERFERELITGSR